MVASGFVARAAVRDPHESGSWRAQSNGRATSCPLRRPNETENHPFSDNERSCRSSAWNRLQMRFLTCRDRNILAQHLPRATGRADPVIADHGRPAPNPGAGTSRYLGGRRHALEAIDFARRPRRRIREDSPTRESSRASGFSPAELVLDRLGRWRRAY